MYGYIDVDVEEEGVEKVVLKKWWLKRCMEVET
jgi:hypothetical protein